MSNSNDRKKGKVLMTLYDKDIFPNKPDITGVVWKDRPTGKVVLFNKKDEIALLGNDVSKLFLLPGGGIEEGEAIIEGTKRECREETGYEIEILYDLGITEDYRSRDNKHCISYGFSAKAISYVKTNLTENEKNIGLHTKWLSLPDAIKLFITQEEKVRRGEVEFYNTCFNIVRDFFFIRQAQKLLK